MTESARNSGEQLLQAAMYFRGDGGELSREQAGRVLTELLPGLCRAYLQRRIGGALEDDMADDAVAHVIEQLLLGKCRAGEPGAAVRFVQVVAHNKYISMIRKRDRERNYAGGQPTEDTSDPAKEFAGREMERQLNKLRQLIDFKTPPKQRKRARIYLDYRFEKPNSPPLIPAPQTEEEKRHNNKIYKDRAVGRSYLDDVLKDIIETVQDETLRQLARKLLSENDGTERLRGNKDEGES